MMGGMDPVRDYTCYMYHNMYFAIFETSRRFISVSMICLQIANYL
jgi:hypothetical protein